MSVIDGGLLWLDFHVTRGVQTRATHYKFDDDQEIEDDEWFHIYHHAFPIGQIDENMSYFINLFQINEEIYAISLFNQYNEQKGKISSTSLVWLATKVGNFNPMQLLPSLKIILETMIKHDIDVTNQLLQPLVDNIIQNSGLLDYSLSYNNQQYELKVPEIPDNLNIPIRFII